MNTKRFTPQLMLLAVATLITASAANAQTSEQNVNVTIRPSQTVEKLNSYSRQRRKESQRKKLRESQKQIQKLSCVARVLFLSTLTRHSSSQFNCKTLCANAQSLTTGKWQLLMGRTNETSPT